MEKKRDLLGVILSLLAGTVCLTAMLIRSFAPGVIIPRLGIPAIVLISVVALLIDYYFAGKSLRNYFIIWLYAALVFGLFPWVSCLLVTSEAIKTAVLGGVIFTLTTFLFDSIIKRISLGPATKLAPLVGGFGIYLASLCFMGIA